MTIERTAAELHKAAMVKVLRTMIRLKHSVLADEELNSVLPAAEHAFDAALQSGELPEGIDITSIARSVVPG
jgi:hypothetical protein